MDHRQEMCMVAGTGGPHRAPRSTTRTPPRGTYFMSVTLVVFKLRGWLNSLALANMFLHQAGADICVCASRGAGVIVSPEDHRGREAL